jgi:Fe-S-cluster-containing dehydrogenase component
MGLRKLFIDIPALIESGVDIDQIECEYLFHRKNNGPSSVIEVAEFASYCRQCKEAFCVEACPKDALEHLDSGVIKRWNMRCVGCKSCVIACPFGTIFPEVINYVSSNCDYCLSKYEGDQDYIPLCVKTSPDKSIQMTEVEEDHENNIFYCGDHLAVKNPNWLSKEGKR